MTLIIIKQLVNCYITRWHIFILHILKVYVIEMASITSFQYIMEMVTSKNISWPNWNEVDSMNCFQTFCSISFKRTWKYFVQFAAQIFCTICLILHKYCYKKVWCTLHIFWAKLAWIPKAWYFCYCIGTQTSRDWPVLSFIS